VADYTRQCWEWHGPQSDSSCVIDLAGSGDDYVSPGGSLYFVVAVDAGMQATHQSTDLNCELYVPPPVTPVNMTASDGLYQGMVLLRWECAADAEYYEIWRQAPSESSYSLLGTSLGPVCADQEIDSLQPYSYQMRAVNTGGMSDFCAPDTGYASSLPPVELTGENVIEGDVTGDHGQPETYLNLVCCGPVFVNTASTYETGHYRIEHLPAGTYLLYPNIGNRQYDPVCEVIEFTGSSSTEVRDFQYVMTDPHPNRVYGFFYANRPGTADDAPLPGVSLSFVGQYTENTYTETTDENGYYSCSDMEYDDYMITPTLDGYEFSPIDELVVVDVISQQQVLLFTARPVVPLAGGDGAINGTVSFAGIDPHGSTISLLGLSQTLQSLAQPETFSFASLPWGIYVVVPFHSTMEFSPPYRILELDATHPSAETTFTARARVSSLNYSGFVSRALVDVGYLGLANAEVTAEDSSSGTAFTTQPNLDGYFLLEPLPVAQYIIGPQKDGWHISNGKWVTIDATSAQKPGFYSAHWRWDD